ncbi:MAG: SAM-dependent methyltransferase [Wenzhouxiangellaceae bacterium]|nr:SAM-dependent methyltransferase [Wenzhouxiangellaceae bacterium]
MTVESGPARAGALVIVGAGIQLGRHVAERALSEIRAADRVFAMLDPFALDWLRSLRPDCENLARFYAAGRDRRETYRDMERVLVEAVRAGERTCAVFYGHPGVFADVPHGAIRAVRALGLPARMEPGISAEACLYADLGLDPGERGVISMEATQFLVHERRPDPTMLLVLWQVALAGDLALKEFSADPDRLRVLVAKLAETYAPDTETILYEAAQLPVQRFRADRMPLAALPEAEYREFTTLVIPACAGPEPDDEWLERLGADRSALE